MRFCVVNNLDETTIKETILIWRILSKGVNKASVLDKHIDHGRVNIGDLSIEGTVYPLTVPDTLILPGVSKLTTVGEVLQIQRTSVQYMEEVGKECLECLVWSGKDVGCR